MPTARARGAARWRGAQLHREELVLMPSYVNIGAYVGEAPWSTPGHLGSCADRQERAPVGWLASAACSNRCRPTRRSSRTLLHRRAQRVRSRLHREENSVISMGFFFGKSTKIYDRSAAASATAVRRGRGGFGQLPAARQPQPVLAVIVKKPTRDARQDVHQQCCAPEAPGARQSNT